MKEEYIYIITNPKLAGCFKVGRTVSPWQRLSSYNTGDPYRQYEFAYLAMVNNAQSIEDEVACEFEDQLVIPGHEWFKPAKHTCGRNQKNFLNKLIKYIESSNDFIRNII